MTFEIFQRLSAGDTTGMERKIIKFSVGSVFCGVDIMAVREILNPAPATPLPGSPPWVTGTADYRSALVPVMDLRIRLGQIPGADRKEKWVVVNADGGSLALLVDQVHEVVSVTAADERDRNPLDGRADISWIRRVYGESDALLFELDLLSLAGGMSDVARGS